MKKLVASLYLCSIVITTTVFAETIASKVTVSNPMEAMVGTCRYRFTPEQGDNSDFVSAATLNIQNQFIHSYRP